MIKEILTKFVYRRSYFRPNLFKTLVVNFTFLPFRDAIKLPVLVLGPCKINAFTGKITLRHPAHFGMLKIGVCDPYRSYHEKSYLEIRGELNIGNHTVLRRGLSLFIKETGKVVLEDDVYVGDNVSIVSAESITIKKATRVANNTVFMDTDFHYTVNTLTREVKPINAPIVIGENNWIGAWCTIKKGCQTPKGTVIAGPYTMAGKNYVGKIPEYSIIAGSPAKLLAEGIRRINNYPNEAIVEEYFKTHTGKYTLPDDIDIEQFCMPT